MHSSRCSASSRHSVATLRYQLGCIASRSTPCQVLNASNIYVTINVPATTDGSLPFATGGTVVLGVCNPLGATTCTPTGSTAQFTIGNNPIIQSVTSAASFQEVSAGVQPTVAPFEMISIFGADFCSSAGAGCTSSQILYPTLNTTYDSYPTSVSFPDPVTNGVTHAVSVSFQNHTTHAVLASAPILFATNSQINTIVPSNTAVGTSGTVDVVVNYSTTTGSGMSAVTTTLSSAAVPVTLALNQPGVFTVGSDGQGQGAILGSNYLLVATGNEAGIRTGAADSDIVSIYMTGLGIPDSSGTVASGGSQSWPADCVSITNYLAALTALLSLLRMGLSSRVRSTIRANCPRASPLTTPAALP